MSLSPVDVVKMFWELMATNNFHSVGSVLSDEFVLEWPQSNERIRGRRNFALMNQEYPAHGRWQFSVHRIIGSDTEAVSDVSVTDSVQHARAISFFSVRDSQIVKMVEFWPEPFAAATNRTHLVEKLVEPR